MIATAHKIYEITSVEYAGTLKLRIDFNDGKSNVVDFEPFLRASKHPGIRKYLDKRRFKKFHLDQGLLMWGDFDLVFPMADLYDGKIS